MISDSKDNNFQALTGGEDAYFISGKNWLGIADGVGQWSLEGKFPDTAFFMSSQEKCFYLCRKVLHVQC